MPGSVRQYDLDSKGLVNMGSSPNTYVNNQPMARYGDSRIPDDDARNNGSTIPGASVFCNNRHSQFIGHGNEKGPYQCQGSPNVIIN